jgi:light-regulated signal transduction histidine kinase (bacteriophytochrome)
MVLNMSASFTRTHDRVVGLDSGADGYLVQPVDPPEFLATVKSLLRIRQAEEQVRRANRDLEQFAYVASHDLQEPLRMVMSYLALLERRYGHALDDTARQYIHFAVDGAGRMSVLVHDLLALSQAERSAISKVPMPATLPLGDALENLKLRIAESGAQITVCDLPPITVDRGLIAQVFQNLIANAIKFRGERTPTVRIEAKREDGFDVFSIQDNGIGIPDDQQERIFGIFQRLHAASEIPGSGIGLSLSRRIVERHGGATGVSSSEGVGSRFWFSIPV